MNPLLQYRCPAKVNLALSVGKPRDDGMHPICSWMVKVSLFDDLTIEKLGENDKSSFDIGWADDAPRPSRIDWFVERDLTFRAHQLLEQHTRRTLPVNATLRKRIPIGAGLGGGSVNAAVVLRVLDEIFELKIDQAGLIELAAQLGSDVAFGLHTPSAIVSGAGERIEDLPLAAPLDLVLILPALHCNTGAVYKAFDALETTNELWQPSAMANLANVNAESADRLFNDLQEAAFEVEPRLRERHERCTEVIGRPPQVTGSGAAMFLLAADAESAKRDAATITRKVGMAALAVRTLES